MYIILILSIRRSESCHTLISLSHYRVCTCYLCIQFCFLVDEPRPFFSSNAWSIFFSKVCCLFCCGIVIIYIIQDAAAAVEDSKPQEGEDLEAHKRKYKRIHICTYFVVMYVPCQSRPSISQAPSSGRRTKLQPKITISLWLEVDRRRASTQQVPSS